MLNMGTLSKKLGTLLYKSWVHFDMYPKGYKCWVQHVLGDVWLELDFSNNAPNKSKLSNDRWKKFKISKDLENVVENREKYGKSKENSFHASVDDDSVDEVNDSVDVCSDSEY